MFWASDSINCTLYGIKSTLYVTIICNDFSYLIFAVCRRVYQHHRQVGITLDDAKLNIQVVPPVVTESDDLCSIELSSCRSDTDPDILQFYLSALADNPVEKLVFNKSDHSHAQVTFTDRLGMYM